MLIEIIGVDMTEVQLDLFLQDKYDRRRHALQYGNIHYSDRIISALVNLGWVSDIDQTLFAKKVDVNPELVGVMEIEHRLIALGVSSDRRYFTIYSGFDVVFEIDGREFDFKPKAAAKLLNDFAMGMYV